MPAFSLPTAADLSEVVDEHYIISTLLSTVLSPISPGDFGGYFKFRRRLPKGIWLHLCLPVLSRISYILNFSAAMLFCESLIFFMPLTTRVPFLPTSARWPLLQDSWSLASCVPPPPPGQPPPSPEEATSVRTRSGRLPTAPRHLRDPAALSTGSGESRRQQSPAAAPGPTKAESNRGTLAGINICTDPPRAWGHRDQPGGAFRDSTRQRSSLRVSQLETSCSERPFR